MALEIQKTFRETDNQIPTREIVDLDQNMEYLDQEIMQHDYDYINGNIISLIKIYYKVFDKINGISNKIKTIAGLLNENVKEKRHY